MFVKDQSYHLSELGSASVNGCGVNGANASFTKLFLFTLEKITNLIL